MISVIIDNHNYGKYISEAIESVLDQTYQNFELIIIDGASTDDSREVITKYATKYSEKITAVFKPTSGQAAAFNLGFQLSHGDVIALLDSDDYFLPNKLEIINDAHQKYSFIGHGRHSTDGGRNFTPIDNEENRPRLLREYGFIYTYNLISSCISANRSLMEKILPMPENGYVTFADCYIKVLAQYFDNIHYIDEPLTMYRFHQENRVNSFQTPESMENFVKELYRRVFLDINTSLQEREMPCIPKMTPEGILQGLILANPGLSLNQHDVCALYGAGSYSPRVKRAAEYCGVRFCFVIDSDPGKWGSEWYGLPVISPIEAQNRRSEYDKIIIGATYYDEIEKVLDGLGFEKNTDYFRMPIVPND